MIRYDTRCGCVSIVVTHHDAPFDFRGLFTPGYGVECIEFRHADWPGGGDDGWEEVTEAMFCGKYVRDVAEHLCESAQALWEGAAG